MDQTLFQRLTSNELEQYLADIDLALEYHSRWLAAVNRTLVCRDEDDLRHFSQNLLHHCYFGRWHAGVEQPLLREMQIYHTIGDVHEELHQTVGELVEKLQRGKSLSVQDYNGFTEVTQSFRQAINDLKGMIKRDLRLIANLMCQIFENADEGVIITDMNASILTVNPAFCKVTGYKREEVLGQTPAILHSGRQGKSFYENMWRELMARRCWQGEIWNKRKDGVVYPEWLNITALLGEEGEVTHYIAIFTDISQQKNNEERLYYLAHYDPLSKLPNRLAFHDRLGQAISRARRVQNKVAVMFLDLDGFKEVNDSLGHNAGDEVIREIAIRLGSAMRETDTIARFGGDEFTILLTEVEAKEGIEIAAQKIIDAVSEPIRIESTNANVTTSIGISLYPQDGDDADQLIRQADMAMYAAKESGKNKYLFYDRRQA